MDQKAIDTTVTSGSSNLITSGAVYAAISASGFECVFSFTGDSNNTMGSIYSGSTSTEGYNWTRKSSSSSSATFPYGTPSVYLTNGPSYIGRPVLYSSSTTTVYPITALYNSTNISAKGSGHVRIYGLFGAGSMGIYTPSSSEHPYIQYDISEGQLVSMSSNFLTTRGGKSETLTIIMVETIEVFS